MSDHNAILSVLPVGIFTTDASGNVTFFNEAATKIWGCRPDLSKPEPEPTWRVFWVDGRPISHNRPDYSSIGGDVTRIGRREGYSEHPDGSRLFFVIDTRHFELDQASSLGTLNLLIDVTDRKIAELQTSRLAAIVEGSDDAIISKTLDGRITSWNAGATRIFGYLPEEVIGQNITIIIPDDLYREEETILNQVKRGQRVEPLDTLRLAKDGRRIDVSLTVSPVRNADGVVIGASKVARDISERKKAQMSALLNEERFKLLARATKDVIRDWDLTNDTVWWNEGLQAIFGYAPEVVDPSSNFWEERVHPDHSARVRSSLLAAIHGEASNWRSEYRFRKADGKYAIVVDRGFIIRDQVGRAIRMVVGMSDATERRDLDDRLRQAQKLEAIGQLTGGVAHDFNNLLTVILGNAEVLTESLTEDLQMRVLAEMTSKAAQRAAELTNRLMAFARKQALEPKVLDVAKLIAGMDHLLRRTLSEDIEIEIVRGGGLWKALIDPGQLEAAILNLAINARDSMRDGGRLTLETANVHLDDNYAGAHDEVTAGQYVMLSVSDTGTGMDVDTITRAFEPFFTTKEIGKGSGLGLSMVYGFVKQSQGHVKIYSELGHGTTIKLYLPRADTDAAYVALPSAAGATPRGSEVVLIVEDDDLVRDHVSGQLKSLGYQIIAARNGPEALEILHQTNTVQLLFTDVVMPGGMNGRQLAEEALKLRPTLRVLFTSGYTENAIVHHGRLDRGVHLLSKPYRKQDLAVKIRLVMDEPRI